MSDAGEVTVLLQRANGGDRAAADALFRLVEKDLRAIVGKRKKRFENALDCSTTMMVDDAFCKLVGTQQADWQPGDRSKFFSYVANKIHDLLVDAARAQLAQKRGAGSKPVELEQVDFEKPGAPPLDATDFMIDLKDALAKLEAFAPQEVEAFRLYYFLACTFDEAAEIMSVSATQTKRLVKKAQMWLQRELKDYHRAGTV